MSIKSLIINPGSTSTKVGVFEDETLLFEETLRHPTEEIAKYASIIDQKDFRKQIILDFLKEKDCDVHSLDVIVGRGGLLKPIPGGTYAVSDELLADLKAGVQGQHHREKQQGKDRQPGGLSRSGQNLLDPHCKGHRGAPGNRKKGADG